MSIDISICICSNRVYFKEWYNFQINKQIEFLKKKGLTYEIIEVLDLNDISEARNLAIKKSKGSYIAFLDDDDWYPDYRLYYQWRSLEIHNKKKKDIHTVSRFLCYDILEKKSFYFDSLSEGSMMFSREYSKEHNFIGFKGEGNHFSRGARIEIEDNTDLILSLTHNENSLKRTIDKAVDNILIDFIPKEIFEKMTDFELKFIDKLFQDIIIKNVCKI